MTLLDDALCTVEEFLDYSQLENLSKDPAYITNLINTVTEWFEGFCDVKSFYETSYTETYDGNAESFLFPQNTPITLVTSLSDDGTSLWSDSTTGSALYRIIQNGKGIYLIDDILSEGVETVDITYVAGYSTIPYDLKTACMTEVLRKYNHRLDFDVIRQTIGANDTEYVSPGMLAETLQILSRYRNYRV